jgi:serine/threonine protein kinase
LALEIATQVAAGLAAVHKQKLVHRDIKPSNIMVSLEDGGAVTAKIIDLGLAKTVSEPLSEAAISMPGVFAGTPCPGFQPLSANLSKASAVECILSRRDSTIVARHGVPGIVRKIAPSQRDD